MTWRAMAQRLGGPILLVVLPVLAKLPLLAGWLQADPLLVYAGLQQDWVPGWVGGGQPTIDPNIGFTSHALGTLAAHDLLAGRMPWWNPFEGVGAPLAGEMQAAALFPPSLLLLLRHGQVWEHVGFQIVAGLATYALLRRLEIARLPAFAGAAVFGFNGVFAWLGNAVANPVAFLPLLLLGLEAAAARVRQRRAGGAVLISLALAGSLYAGFPEVAYLDGLLALAWLLMRAASLGDRAPAYLVRVAVAGLAGLLIAAPIVLAFADYLPLAAIGGHADTGAADPGSYYPHVSADYLPMLALPYWLGGIFAGELHGTYWGSVGGYVGATPLVLGVAGLIGAIRGGRDPALRLALAAWVVVSLGMIYGAPWLSWLVHTIPFLRQAAFSRYLTASLILAVAVLAARGLDDLRGRGMAWRVALGVALLAGTGAVVLRQGDLTIYRADYVRVCAAIVLGGAVTLCGLALWPGLDGRWRRRGLAAIMTIEAISWFVLPTLSYPQAGTVERAAVTFLQQNLGLQRVASFGTLAPNYAAYFGIASVDHNDLPVPAAWVGYIRGHLDANANPIVFNGDARADPAGPSAIAELRRNAAGYEAVGVRYVVVPPDRPLPDFREVFRDRAMIVYELAKPAAYFSAPGCQLAPRGRDKLTANCQAPSRVQRLELAMPGWQAWVDDKPAEITTTGEIFQSVAVPAGSSSVRFAFTPPYMRAAFTGAAIGLLLLLAPLVRRWAQNPQATVRSLPRIRLR